MALTTINSGTGALIEYLAVRISMELAIAKPYLPLKIKRLRKSFDRPTYSFLDLLGNISTREWSQMSAN